MKFLSRPVKSFFKIKITMTRSMVFSLGFLNINVSQNCPKTSGNLMCINAFSNKTVSKGINLISRRLLVFSSKSVHDWLLTGTKFVVLCQRLSIWLILGLVKLVFSIERWYYDIKLTSEIDSSIFIGIICTAIRKFDIRWSINWLSFV